MFFVLLLFPSIRLGLLQDVPSFSTSPAFQSNSIINPQRPSSQASSVTDSIHMRVRSTKMCIRLLATQTITNTTETTLRNPFAIE
ncbi:hypothetical protein PGTUg99_036078 [Puccinia graminis f. sp. tritici]|uniref:Secreted protein n=1 Tax=Puccinia graminis f. sp. tritici TaxID=56615 RepID=A0A5B0QVB6_PUCGR|nr:hypothetical protein PGTUg99_036078 [Puccinia graminis f. sp. tritici]